MDRRGVRMFLALGLSTALACLAPATAFAAPGNLDARFSTDGLVINHHREAGIAVQANGRVLFLADDFTVLRYTKAGALDSSFGGNGSAHADFATSDQSSSAIAVQPDGAIVVAGTVDLANGTHTALARFLPDGSLDPSFSTDGLKIRGGGTQVDPTAIAIDAAGHVIAGSGRAVMEFSRDGSVRKAFGSNGIAEPVMPGTNGRIRSVGVQSSGKIIIGGDTSVSCCTQQMLAGRLTARGDVDPTFGEDGFRLVSVHPFTSFTGSMVVAADGAITLAGESCFSDEFNSCDHAVARLSASGTIEATGGIQPNGPFIQPVSGVALQGAKTVAVGGTNTGDFNQWCVDRFNADLSPDPTWGGDGFVCTSFGGTDESAAHVAVDGGRILVSGNSGVQDHPGGVAAYRRS